MADSYHVGGLHGAQDVTSGRNAVKFDAAGVVLPADTEKLISTKDLAARLSVGISTVERLRASGRIGPRPVRIGGSLRYVLSEVLAWVTTRSPSGELYDVESWPAVWAAMQKTTSRRHG